MDKIFRVHSKLLSAGFKVSSFSSRSFRKLQVRQSSSSNNEACGQVFSRTLWSSSSERDKREGVSKLNLEVPDHDHSKLLHDTSSQLMVGTPHGVMSENKQKDIELLTMNFTAPALAAALRDREQTLQHAASLLATGRMEDLKHLLEPYHEDKILRRRKKKRDIDVSRGFQPKHLHMLRKYLHRMPRHINRQTDRRASVLMPLCNIEGQASVLFTKRSDLVRSHKSQVCFPGGNVDDNDDNIVETSLREMEEEIGINQDTIEILGVLRCDWSEIASIVGMAVTPVVGFVHDINPDKLNPNPDEVAHCFAVPLSKLLDSEAWMRHEHRAPVFTGGPHVVWGLTAYILDKFLKDVVLRYRVNFGGTDFGFRQNLKNESK